MQVHIFLDVVNCCSVPVFAHCAGSTSFLLHLTKDNKVTALSLKKWDDAQQEGGKVSYLHSLIPVVTFF